MIQFFLNFILFFSFLNLNLFYNNLHAQGLFNGGPLVNGVLGHNIGKMYADGQKIEKKPGIFSESLVAGVLADKDNYEAYHKKVGDSKYNYYYKDGRHHYFFDQKKCLKALENIDNLAETLYRQLLLSDKNKPEEERQQTLITKENIKQARKVCAKQLKYYFFIYEYLNFRQICDKSPDNSASKEVCKKAINKLTNKKKEKKDDATLVTEKTKQI
jgi:hypothetical protein